MIALHMTWESLAFLHWPVPVSALRDQIPVVLEIDTFDGSAWVAITPFVMRNVRPSFTPPIPTARDFPELNVRTYVRYKGRIGVWFFSLDASSWLAVQAARVAVGLPYRHARMQARRVSDGTVYESVRIESGVPAAEFSATYRAAGDVAMSLPDSFEFWATERYSLFALRGGALLRLDIEHEPWPLQPATIEIRRNTMASAAGIPLPDMDPRVHYAGSLDVDAHWPVSG